MRHNDFSFKFSDCSSEYSPHSIFDGFGDKKFAYIWIGVSHFFGNKNKILFFLKGFDELCIMLFIPYFVDIVGG